MEKELIALLPPEDRKDGRQVSSALVRFADGRMAVVDCGADTVRIHAPSRHFQRSQPIIDPATREVIGYEMEQVRMKSSA